MTSAICDDDSNPASISLQAGETVTCVFHNKKATVEICNQVLVNPQLDIVEFGDGSGTAEPWLFLRHNVYFTKDPALAYDGYSLVMVDGDDGDQTPDSDMMAQGFLMPDNLSAINVEYQRATQNSNSGDEIYGELWLLDDDWVLHLDNPTTYFVGGWTVDESEASWGKQTITSNDPAFLGQMAGQKMAILLFTITDGGGTTAAQKEEVFFDDVKLTACYEEVKAGGEIFLPALMRKFGVSAGPICIPPNENPLDQFHSFRGLVQTNATCNSTLSFVDRADYYTFKPEKDGPHTLHLTNLPDETEWSAMIFTDTPSPDYAPGGASDGKCRITTPGAGDKQATCGLNKGSDYFVKVSSGSTAVAGSYTMRITAP